MLFCYNLSLENSMFLFILVFTGRWESHHEWRDNSWWWGGKGKRVSHGGTCPLVDQIPDVWRCGQSAWVPRGAETRQQQHWDQHKKAKFSSPRADSKKQTFFSPFTGEKPDPDQTFKLTSLQNFSSCLPNSCTTLVSNHSLSHRQPETVLTETPQDTIVSILYTSVKNIVKMKNSDLS